MMGFKQERNVGQKRDANIQRMRTVLDHLELDLASEFARKVKAVLRRLNDGEINTLYLLTHTPSHLGEPEHVWIKALMPVIEDEFDLRRDIAMEPSIGPIVAPELYTKGGGHDVPF